jgi:hypothetical protein
MTTDAEKTAALEALIRGVNPLADDPLKFLDQIEAILDEKEA